MNLQFYSIILFCMNWIRAIWVLTPQYFNYIMAISFIGGGIRIVYNIYIYRIGLKGYSTIETNKKRPVWDISTCFFFSMSTRVKVEQQYE